MANIYKRGRTWWARAVVLGVEHRVSLKTHHEAVAREKVRQWGVNVNARDYVAAMRGGLGPMKVTPKTPDGFIYAIGYGDKVKIGWAISPRERRATLQTGCPEDLILYGSRVGTIAEEKALHRRFAEWQIRDEWFRLEGDVADWVSAVASRTEQKPPSPTVPAECAA